MSSVAVVTGSNKGIGFEIVRAMCKRFPGDVYLTARDPGRGQEAVAKLQEEGLHPLFHQLDIDDPQSIRALRDFLKQKYGGLNVLVNNAAIAFKGRKQTGLVICGIKLCEEGWYMKGFIKNIKGFIKLLLWDFGANTVLLFLAGQAACYLKYDERVT